MVEIGTFAIDAHCVSKSRFASFVAATGHVTDAERYGASFVFGGLLPDDFPHTRHARIRRRCAGADRGVRWILRHSH